MTRHVGPLRDPCTSRARMARSTGSGRRTPGGASSRSTSTALPTEGGSPAPATARRVLVLVLEGTASVSVGGVAMGAVGTRETVFDEPPAGVVLCAPGEDIEAIAQGRPARHRGRPGRDVQRTAVIAPETILVETRGEGSSERTIKNLLPPSAEAGRLIAVEAYTPGGNWSSYPPHKHDTDDPPNESAPEELYFYRLRSPPRLRHPAR